MGYKSSIELNEGLENREREREREREEFRELATLTFMRVR